MVEKSKDCVWPSKLESKNYQETNEKHFRLIGLQSQADWQWLPVKLLVFHKIKLIVQVAK